MRGSAARQRREKALVAAVLLAVPGREYGAAELTSVTKVRSRQLHALLDDWMDRKWLERRWGDPHTGAVLQRTFHVTDLGSTRLADIFRAGMTTANPYSPHPHERQQA